MVLLNCHYSTWSTGMNAEQRQAGGTAISGSETKRPQHTIRVTQTRRPQHTIRRTHHM